MTVTIPLICNIVMFVCVMLLSIALADSRRDYKILNEKFESYMAESNEYIYQTSKYIPANPDKEVIYEKLNTDSVEAVIRLETLQNRISELPNDIQTYINQGIN